VTEDAVDAAIARQHVKMLLFRRYSEVEIARLSGVPRPTIVGLMTLGDRQWSSVSRSVSDRLCAIPMPEGYRTPNPGGPVHMSEVEEELADPADDASFDSDTAWNAMRTVAAFAQDADELRVFRSMLGLDNAGPPPCTNCGRPVTRVSAQGDVRTAGEGMCAVCFQAESSRRRRKAETR
jgi:hypothetical protein